jgi:hypothetical protein
MSGHVLSVWWLKNVQMVGDSAMDEGFTSEKRILFFNVKMFVRKITNRREAELLGCPVQIPAQNGPDIRCEAQGVQKWQDIQQTSVRRVAEPGLDWNGVFCKLNYLFRTYACWREITSIIPVSRRGIVQNEYRGKVGMNGGQILCVPAKDSTSLQGIQKQSNL